MGVCTSAPKVASGLGNADESSTGKNPYLVSSNEDSGGGGGGRAGSGGEGKVPTAASSGEDGLTDLSQFKRDYSGRLAIYFI